MPELAAVICFRRSFFDAASKNSLVFASWFPFGRAPKLFGKIDVLDTKESEVNITIECLGTDNLPPEKQTFFQCIADASIRRPSVFEELLLNKRDEIGFFEEIAVLQHT